MGDQEVGKTSIINRFIYDKFTETNIVFLIKIILYLQSQQLELIYLQKIILLIIKQ